MTKGGGFLLKNQGVYNLIVYDMISVGEKRWDIDKIASLFPIEVVHTIIYTPLFILVQDSCLVWADDQNGIYSVRSGYKLMINELFYVDQFQVEGDWNCLWRVNTPHKNHNLL